MSDKKAAQEWWELAQLKDPSGPRPPTDEQRGEGVDYVWHVSQTATPIAAHLAGQEHGATRMAEHMQQEVDALTYRINGLNGDVVRLQMAVDAANRWWAQRWQEYWNDGGPCQNDVEIIKELTAKAKETLK